MGTVLLVSALAIILGNVEGDTASVLGFVVLAAAVATAAFAADFPWAIGAHALQVLWPDAVATTCRCFGFASTAAAAVHSISIVACVSVELGARIPAIDAFAA